MENENSQNYYFSQSYSYIKCKINQLNDLKQKMEKLMLNILDYQSKISLHIDKANSEYNAFIKFINDYIDWLNSVNINMNDSNLSKVNKEKSYTYYDNMRCKCFSYYEYTKYLVDNNYIKIIDKEIGNINDTINNQANLIFDPPNINSFNNNNNINISFSSNKSSNSSSNKINEENITSFNDIYRNHLNDLEDFYSEEDSLSFVCSYCKINQVVSYCEHCSNFFCQICIQDIQIFEKNEDHKIIKIEHMPQFERKEEKKTFLNSISKLIKYVLLKSNSLLLKDKEINENEFFRSKDNKFKIEYIKTYFNYPKIDDEINIESYLNFLKSINSILSNKFKENMLNLNSFNITTDVGYQIIDTIKPIFNDEKLKIIEEDYHSDDEFEIENHLIKIKESEYSELKNRFYYSINMISKDKFFNNSNNNKISGIFLNKIHTDLLIDKKDIFITFNNRNNFLDCFIQSRVFSELKPKYIKNNYIYDKLYEIKMIIEKLLIEECKIDPNIIDYKGNFINPNKSFNNIRGTEIYDPPYGWFGIGLNVIGKFDDGNDIWINDNSKDSKWAIAYHGLGAHLPSELLKSIINAIINNEGLKPGNNQLKAEDNDKRHPNKKIGKGIYLTPNIKMAEGYSGIINFNKKKYKVALMVRVKIDEIREPSDINYWILDNKYIRIYRIIFKEML